MGLKRELFGMSAHTTAEARPDLEQPRPLKLLSLGTYQISPRRTPALNYLDGGGIRGLASLIILKYLMQQINRQSTVPVKPCQYFDLIGGTSTGGCEYKTLLTTNKAAGS